ncbi:MAG TPA: hypothetical protein VKW78_02655 [Terriglobales bacterium]|nr:hypothetical protein [Terriglobales bacterium]
MFAAFAERISRLSPGTPSTEELKPFLLEETDRAQIYYAPLDWVNKSAKIIVVGITPGRATMLKAFQVASLCLREGRSWDEALKRAKQVASFSNARSAIGTMFDELGIPEVLGLSRSADLFESKQGLLHPTSCVRYPVFVRHRNSCELTNYTGHSPRLLDWETSRRYIKNLLGPELQEIPDALVVPCGVAVDSALRHLVDLKAIEPTRCLFGFPHPSGANGHRLTHFAKRRDELKQMVIRWAEQLAP